MIKWVGSDEGESTWDRFPWGTAAFFVIVAFWLGGSADHVGLVTIALVVVFALLLFAPYLRAVMGPAVKVRCASCRGLSDEEARFCGSCGKPM